MFLLAEVAGGPRGVRGGTDGHGRRCCGRGRAAAGGGVVALPGVLGGAGGVGPCPRAGHPRSGRGGLAAAAAQVAVRGCGVTHVLLPVSCLLRRADGVAVIWAALAGKAAGLGYRPIAAGLGRPASTVRDWLARFAGRAGAVRELFTVWLCALDADPPPLASRGLGGGRRGGRGHRGCSCGGRALGGAAGQPVAGRAGQLGERGAAAVAVVGAGVDQHQSGLGGGLEGRQGCWSKINPPLPLFWRLPMTAAGDEEARRAGRARAVALFRYSLIREAADPGLSTRQRGRLVRELAAREHAGPFGEPVTVSRPSLDRWIRAWRSGGFDALAPPARQVTPRTPAEVLELAAALKRENPDRTAAQVARVLRASGGWSPSERTLQRHFARLELDTRPDGSPPPAFGRFEAARPNEMLDRRRAARARHRRPQDLPVRVHRRPLAPDHRAPVRPRRGHRPPRRGAAARPGQPRRPRPDLRRQRLRVRRCLAAARLRRARHQAHPLHPGPPPLNRPIS